MPDTCPSVLLAFTGTFRALAERLVRLHRHGTNDAHVLREHDDDVLLRLGQDFLGLLDDGPGDFDFDRTLALDVLQHRIYAARREPLPLQLPANDGQDRTTGDHLVLVLSRHVVPRYDVSPTLGTNAGTPRAGGGVVPDAWQICHAQRPT